MTETSVGTTIFRGAPESSDPSLLCGDLSLSELVDVGKTGGVDATVCTCTESGKSEDLVLWNLTH